MKTRTWLLLSVSLIFLCGVVFWRAQTGDSDSQGRTSNVSELRTGTDKSGDSKQAPPSKSTREVRRLTEFELLEKADQALTKNDPELANYYAQRVLKKDSSDQRALAILESAAEQKKLHDRLAEEVREYMDRTGESIGTE